jgi:hypothetical protein
LRHSDYLELYRQAGFVVVGETPTKGSTVDHETIRNLVVDPRFHQYPPEDLAIRRAWVVLKKCCK